MTSQDHSQSRVQTSVEVASARDLADFFLRWASFRPVALAVATSHSLAANERDVVGWLIKLADRVGDRDLLPAVNCGGSGLDDPRSRSE
jgi:hypothetical protein